MYGDPEVLRRHADQLREQAVDVRTLADQLVVQTESIGWHGRAADSMRVRVTERATHLRAAAAQHETAADALTHHAQEASRGREAIADVERRATLLVADDPTLAAFEPPPSGHVDWLAVELPGL